MVWKVTRMLILTAIMSCILCMPTFAVTHSVYDQGNINSTYVNYFKDICSGIGYNQDYIAFQSGQYSYTMVVGELDYNNGTVTLTGDGKEYTFSREGNNYNQYRYDVKDITNFSVNTSNYILYSNVGDYPQLIERGAKIETVTLTLLCIICLFNLVVRIFSHS